MAHTNSSCSARVRVRHRVISAGGTSVTSLAARVSPKPFSLRRAPPFGRQPCHVPVLVATAAVAALPVQSTPSPPPSPYVVASTCSPSFVKPFDTAPAVCVTETYRRVQRACQRHRSPRRRLPPWPFSVATGHQWDPIDDSRWPCNGRVRFPVGMSSAEISVTLCRPADVPAGLGFSLLSIADCPPVIYDLIENTPAAECSQVRPTANGARPPAGYGATQTVPFVSSTNAWLNPA